MDGFFQFIKIVMLVAGVMVAKKPILSGWVTYYDCPPYCGAMHNGDLYDPFGQTAAVDITEYASLEGHCLMVIPDAGGSYLKRLFVTVTDSGYLYRGSKNWSHPIVLDLPEATFWLISPMGESGRQAGIFKARVWIVPDEMCPNPHGEGLAYWKDVFRRGGDVSEGSSKDRDDDGLRGYGGTGPPRRSDYSLPRGVVR